MNLFQKEVRATRINVAISLKVEDMVLSQVEHVVKKPLVNMGRNEDADALITLLGMN